MARILMVDDNEQFLKPMRALLVGKGHDVEALSGGAEARQRLQECSYDILISDVAMEPVSGMDLLDLAKHINEEMPVIMLTAYATFENALQAVKLGAFDLLTKPFRVDELLDTIARAQKWQSAGQAGTVGAARDVYRATKLKEYLRSQVPTFPGKQSTKRDAQS
jgi:DNA-binding NtrC family response regulator